MSIVIVILIFFFSAFNPQAQQHPQQNVVYIQPIPESYRGAQNRNR